MVFFSQIELGREVSKEVPEVGWDHVLLDHAFIVDIVLLPGAGEVFTHPSVQGSAAELVGCFNEPSSGSLSVELCENNSRGVTSSGLALSTVVLDDFPHELIVVSARVDLKHLVDLIIVRVSAQLSGVNMVGGTIHGEICRRSSKLDIRVII